MKTIVVTGMGAVSPYGIGVPRLWDALCNGESAIGDLTRFDLKDFAYTRGGEIRDFHLPKDCAATGANTDLATQFMLAAAAEALREGFPAPSETGVVLATNFGGINSGENVITGLLGKRTAQPSDYSESLFQSCADHVAKQWHLGGPRFVLSLSCASGTAAIGYGMDLIRHGHAKAVLTGGYDALSRFAWSGLSALRTMTKDALRPFDKNRSGTLFSEGAGALLLEDEESARERGATIYAEIAGYGANNNAFHMTAPAKEGAGSAAVMQMALHDARMKPEEIDHINAHGTGTKPNDVTETQAIKKVFGAHAYTMPITSIKSSSGHLLGAAGSIEAIASILSIRDQLIPPTTNYRDPDPECDLPCVANVKKSMVLRAVLSNSAGIGGCNAAVIFRRAE
ncbi:MAG: beta-ketoacyl-[acyl-carrier-protein] synthase family protein [bacterium]